MIKKPINQNDSFDLELLNSIENNYVFENNPINRLNNENTASKTSSDEKIKNLENLKKEINSIENCKLKENASKIVFSDGNTQSPIMIVGEGPGQKEDELGKPFVGDAGSLLNKMLKAINIEREKVYITNVVNYRPPNNRKPETSEINRYSKFLKEHISIIDPQILILMGSTAMEALIGINKKISKERGQWKEVIIKQKTYKTIITFHPAYLLRQPEQKKFSWKDLKIIRKEIDVLNIKI
jgi:DNA polymerase|tara:strand:+ start:112 stop:831 length:720 start_codon:yes stop_codon:yes gene_type:complete